MATLKPLSGKGSHSDRSCLRPRGHNSYPDCCSVDGPLNFLFCCPDGQSLQACVLGCHFTVPMCTFNTDLCMHVAIWCEASTTLRLHHLGALLLSAYVHPNSIPPSEPLALMTTARAQHCEQCYMPGRTEKASGRGWQHCRSWSSISGAVRSGPLGREASHVLL